MKFFKPLILAAGMLVVASVSAEDLAPAGQPYATIAARNMFGLVPIPPPAPPEPPPVDPPPKITPNGIMNIFGKVQVLFKVALVKPLPGQTETSYVMCAGERQDGIEVVKIDEKAAAVTFDNHGKVETLTLEIAKNPTGGGAGNVVAPGGIPLPRIGGGFRGGANRPGMGGQIRNENVANPGVPSLGGGHSGNTVQPQQEPMSPEGQVLMIEAQRAMYKAAGNPVHSILPPTQITRDLEDEAANQNNGIMPTME